MQEQAIVRYTEQVAQQIAHEFSEDPFGELRVWLRIAHRREAMVTELYEVSEIDRRLSKLEDAGAGAFTRAAIVSIGAHEQSHTRFLGALRGLSESFSGLTELMGRLEGVVTRHATGGLTLASMLIAIGSWMDAVPDFAADLRRMGLRELLAFHRELETTACLGYERMLSLLQALRGDARVMNLLGFTFAFDVAKILCEERFHDAVFQTMQGWIAPDDTAFVSMTAAQCAKQLHALCDRHLSVAQVFRTADLPQPVAKGPGPHWASDGGLGSLFEQHALPVPLIVVG